MGEIRDGFFCIASMKSIMHLQQWNTLISFPDLECLGLPSPMMMMMMMMMNMIMNVNLNMSIKMKMMKNTSTTTRQQERRGVGFYHISKKHPGVLSETLAASHQSYHCHVGPVGKMGPTGLFYATWGCFMFQQWRVAIDLIQWKYQG